MMKQTLSAIAVILLLSSCSAFKQLGTSASRPPVQNTVTPEQQGELKFLAIDVSVEKTNVKNTAQPAVAKKTDTKPASMYTYTSGIPSIESASPLQFKYAMLLNTEVEDVKDIKLYEFIDDWYGTRYCMGGTSKSCIDCSAFVQTFFAAMYSTAVPRTAREQYKTSQRISTTELQQGDLLFFNTRGGVSHVGIYLQNNKFVHASTSGVMISDMFEAYWVKHLIGAGRINKNAIATSN